MCEERKDAGDRRELRDADAGGEIEDMDHAVVACRGAPRPVGQGGDGPYLLLVRRRFDDGTLRARLLPRCGCLVVERSELAGAEKGDDALVLVAEGAEAEARPGLKPRIERPDTRGLHVLAVGRIVIEPEHGAALVAGPQREPVSAAVIRELDDAVGCEASREAARRNEVEHAFGRRVEIASEPLLVTAARLPCEDEAARMLGVKCTQWRRQRHPELLLDGRQGSLGHRLRLPPRDVEGITVGVEPSADPTSDGEEVRCGHEVDYRGGARLAC